MKKLFILFALFIIGLSSCQKVTTSSLAITQANIDDAKIQAYIKANNLTYTKDPSGVYYQILIPGDPSNMPTASSTVKITYTTTYLNGISIGRVEGASAKLNTFIKGLQIGILKIGKDGRINLLIPSGQAYGSGEQNGIPGNSVLYYKVDLNGVAAN